MQVKAAVLRETNQPLTIESVEIDDPRPDEVLVRTVACGVCHSDLHYVHGLLNVERPAVLGHEPAGIVEAVGSAVTSVKPGDRVICCTTIHCGRCVRCLSGLPHLCANLAACRRGADEGARLSQGGSGIHQFVDLAAFAEAMLVHESAVVKIGDDIPLDRAALLGCAVMTGVGAALNTAKVTPGSTVAVFGAGGIGISIIQGARIAGAKQIIAIDLLDSKLETAKKFGATDTLNPKDIDVVRTVRRMSGGGVDFAFEAVGNTKLVEQAFYALAPHGTATMVGAPPAGQKLEVNPGHFFQEKKIQGCYMGSTRFQIDAPNFLEFYRQGRLNLDDMVSRTMPLDDVNESFRAMEAGEVTRSVLTFA
jgi:S-(hydroxymethyl)glutathione dehydrogenase/alcohol dehydrogenase